jgi:cystathionine beta-synthase
VKTARDIIASKSKDELLTITAGQKISEAIVMMTTNDIDQLPVTKNGVIVGSITQHRIFSKLSQDQDFKSALVESIMDKPLPEVNADITLERLSTLINRDNPAVLAIDGDRRHIITQFDVIKALGK